MNSSQRMAKVTMNRLCKLLTLILALCAITVACSKEKNQGVQTSTRHVKEAIEEYGREPINKAKKAQSLGEERLKAIDEAMKKIDSP